MIQTNGKHFYSFLGPYINSCGRTRPPYARACARGGRAATLHAAVSRDSRHAHGSSRGYPGVRLPPGLRRRDRAQPAAALDDEAVAAPPAAADANEGARETAGTLEHRLGQFAGSCRCAPRAMRPAAPACDARRVAPGRASCGRVTRRAGSSIRVGPKGPYPGPEGVPGRRSGESRAQPGWTAAGVQHSIESQWTPPAGGGKDYIES